MIGQVLALALQVSMGSRSAVLAEIESLGGAALRGKTCMLLAQVTFHERGWEKLLTDAIARTEALGVDVEEASARFDGAQTAEGPAFIGERGIVNSPNDQEAERQLSRACLQLTLDYPSAFTPFDAEQGVLVRKP